MPSDLQDGIYLLIVRLKFCLVLEWIPGSSTVKIIDHQRLIFGPHDQLQIPVGPKIKWCKLLLFTSIADQAVFAAHKAFARNFIPVSLMALRTPVFVARFDYIQTFGITH